MWERAKWACKREAEGMKKEVPANATDATNPDEEKEDLTPKEKMDKRMALLRQRRVQKRVQVEMDKVVAQTEAMEELAEEAGAGTAAKEGRVAEGCQRRWTDLGALVPAALCSRTSR